MHNALMRHFQWAVSVLKAPVVLKRRAQYVFALTLIVLLPSCASSPPKNTHNLCDIFDEKSSWYKKAKKARKRWGIPISVSMATMYQESKFVAKARPPRGRFLWIFPGRRPSTAYGYSQAKTETWKWYKKQSGHWGADRNDFDDAIDFVAWYHSISVSRLGIKQADAYSLYLAYHEGHGGFERRSFKNKSWLKKVAASVGERAKMYRSQLLRCEKRLNRSWWPF